MLAEEARKRQIELAGTRPNRPVENDTLPKELGKVAQAVTAVVTSGNSVSRHTQAAAAQAAAIVGTNRQYVSNAKKIVQQAPDLVDSMRAGTITITDAKHELKERDREQVHEQNRVLVAQTPPLVQPISMQLAAGHTSVACCLPGKPAQNV